MKRRLICLFLCSLMILSSVGCGATKNSSDEFAGVDLSVDEASDFQSEDIQVGIVLPTTDEPRWLQDQKEFERALRNQGFLSKVLFSQGSTEIEKANVESLIADGIEVLIICAQDAAAASGTVEAAKEAGVTVICYDRLITYTEAVDYYITFDSVSVGEAQGQYIVDNRPEGTGIPLYLYAGALRDNNSFLFFEGAWNVLEPYIEDGTFVIANSSVAQSLSFCEELTYEQELSVITQITTDWDYNTAMTKAEAHLIAAPDSLKGDVCILAPNDSTSRAISDAFSIDDGITSYVITGQDAEVASINYIVKGMQSMTVFKNTSILASDACGMAAEILNGDIPDTDTVYANGFIDVPTVQTNVTVITSDNYKAELIDSGYYTSSEIDSAIN